jgi:hypothetical protein
MLKNVSRYSTHPRPATRESRALRLVNPKPGIRVDAFQASAWRIKRALYRHVPAVV